MDGIALVYPCARVVGHGLFDLGAFVKFRGGEAWSGKKTVGYQHNNRRYFGGGKVNELLHGCAEHIQGRLGLPCRNRERPVNVICVVIDAPGDVTSALSGKLGMLKGVSSKTITSKA
jgi:putative iron-only hydrogenase system regulator